MPGSVTIVEALGAPTIPASQDFAVVCCGYSTASPLDAGLMSAPYSSAATFAAVFGIGDGADLVTQAITPTQGNPKPPPVCFYRTPATTPGVRGATLSSTFVGTATVSKTSGTTPVGTYEPKGRVVTGGTIGVAGIVIEFSPDGGRTYLPSQALGTATTIKMQIAGTDTGVQFDFTTAATAALYTALNNLRTAVLAHFLIVSGGTPVHAAADTTDNTALTAIPVATTGATAVALFNGILSRLGTHGASAVYHTTADTVLATALAAITTAVNQEDVELGLTALTAAYNAHRILVGAGPVHGSADGTNTVSAFVAVPGTLEAGDVWTESVTTPPMFATADLYAAGPPATGVFGAIGQSAVALAIVAFSEPVASADFPTITTALDYLEARGKRVAVLARFRPRASDETDAVWIAAFATFCAACSDNRIAIVCGEGWLTDAFRAYRYMRSGLPAVLARMQSFEAVPGSLGERMAQHPGWVARGPLENFSIVDDAGNPISLAHDEKLAGGIDGPLGGRGGGIAFYYNRIPSLAGTYVSRAPVRYAALSRCLTWMDRRVLNGIETIAEATLWLSIQGADILDGTTLDPDIVEAQGSTVSAAIRDRYEHEFQNASDPNLVAVNPTVTISGAEVSETATCSPKLFGYTDAITLTVSASRG